MKIEELRQLKADKVAEVRKLNDENKIEDAEKALEEVRGLDKQIKIAEELEADEVRSLQEQKAKKEERGAKMENTTNKVEKVNEMRAITKYVMGAGRTQEDIEERGLKMSTEERAVIKSSDNSAVLPDQFINQLQEIKKGFGSLKELCDVIPVTKNSGKMPVVDYDQNELADVAEGADIVDGTLVTTDIEFNCSKVGLIQTLSSELVDDAEVEIESIARNNFTEISVAKENKKIMAVVDTNATSVIATDYTALEDVMAKALPTVKAGLITLANVEAYAHLKNMKDKQGRNMNLITEVNGVEYYNGKPIYTFDSSLVTPSEGMTKIFYSLSMKEAVKFFDRKGVTVARSTEAGFNDDTVKLRILERLAVVKGSIRSVKKIELA